ASGRPRRPRRRRAALLLGPLRVGPARPRGRGARARDEVPEGRCAGGRGRGRPRARGPDGPRPARLARRGRPPALHAELRRFERPRRRAERRPVGTAGRGRAGGAGSLPGRGLGGSGGPARRCVAGQRAPRRGRDPRAASGPAGCRVTSVRAYDDGMGTGEAAAVAYDELYRAHHSFLWGLLYRLTGNAADAEDLVQETFVRALAH